MALILKNLKKSQEFRIISGSGSKVHTSHFLILYIPLKQQDIDVVNVGITASKRVGKAVQRNFCKRRMRSLSREALAPALHHPCSMVIIARQSMITADYQDLKRDMAYCARKINDAVL